MRRVSAAQEPFVFWKGAGRQQGSQRSHCSRLHFAEAENAPGEIVYARLPAILIPRLRIRYIRASRGMHLCIILRAETAAPPTESPLYERRLAPASFIALRYALT
jgi:hypothetical protein